MATGELLAVLTESCQRQEMTSGESCIRNDIIVELGMFCNDIV
jgi:hypothetical protein